MNKVEIVGKKINEDTCVFEYCKGYDDYRIYQWAHDRLFGIGDTFISKTIAIIYPKGKRPDLGYPCNKLNQYLK